MRWERGMWAARLEGKKVRDRKLILFIFHWASTPAFSVFFYFQPFRRHSNKLIFQFARSPCHISPKGYHVSPLNHVTRYRSRCIVIALSASPAPNWMKDMKMFGGLNSHLGNGNNQLVHKEILEFLCISTWSSATPHLLPPRHDIRSCLAACSNQFKHTKCNL